MTIQGRMKMQIVIELDEDIIEWLNDGVGLTDYQYIDLINAITNGTPLPKGHGDLIDRKELLKMKRHFEDFDGDVFDIIHEETVINAPTIIPANKEE